MARPTYAEAKLKAIGFSNRQTQFIILALDNARQDTDLTADEVLSAICGFVLDSVMRERYRAKAQDVPGQCYMFPMGGTCAEN